MKLKHTILNLALATLFLNACSEQNAEVVPQAPSVPAVASVPEQAQPNKQISWLKDFPVYYKTPDPDGSRALAILENGLQDIFANATPEQQTSLLKMISMENGYGYQYEEKAGLSDSASMLYMWAAHILTINRRFTDTWCNQLQQNYSADIIAPIFKMTGTPEALRCLDHKIFKKVKWHNKFEPISFRLDIYANGVTVPEMWAHFYATGNPKHVYHIIDYLSTKKGDVINHPRKRVPNNYTISSYSNIAAGLHNHVYSDKYIKEISDKYIAILTEERKSLLLNRLLLNYRGGSYAGHKLSANKNQTKTFPPEKRLEILNEYFKNEPNLRPKPKPKPTNPNIQRREISNERVLNPAPERRLEPVQKRNEGGFDNLF